MQLTRTGVIQTKATVPGNLKDIKKLETECLTGMKNYTKMIMNKET